MASSKKVFRTTHSSTFTIKPMSPIDRDAFLAKIKELSEIEKTKQIREITRMLKKMNPRQVSALHTVIDSFVRAAKK